MHLWGVGRTLLSSLRSQAAAALFAPTNNTIYGIGDSITHANSIADATIQAQTIDGSGVGGYLTLTCILPKTGDAVSTGRLRFGGTSATGGYTIAQITSTHLPVLLALSPLPGLAAPLAGTNNLGSMFTGGHVLDPSLASGFADDVATGIWDPILAAGMVCVCQGIPPNKISGSNDLRQAVISFNAFLHTHYLARLAAGKKVIWFDCNGVLGNGAGDWLDASYHAGDAIHPSYVGAKWWAQGLRDAVDAYLLVDDPVLVAAAVQNQSRYLWQNGAFVDVSTTSGVPKGGRVEQSGAWSLTANGTTWALAPRAGFDGQAWEWSKASGVQSTAIGATSGTIPPLLTEGVPIEDGFRVEIASWDATGVINVQITDSTQAIKVSRLKLANSDGIALPPFVWYGTPVPPTGFGTAQAARVSVTLDGVADFFLGQLTIGDPTIPVVINNIIDGSGNFVIDATGRQVIQG